MLKLWGVFLGLFIAVSSLAQEAATLTTKFGVGPPLGGYGVKLELAKSHYVAYASLGFSPSYRPTEGIKVSSSINPLVGFQYRFLFPEKPFNTRFGAHVGWMDNYYSNAIGSAPYNSNVYGVSFGSGVELFIDNFTIETDIYVRPGFFVFNPEDHPYYETGWGASVAIGYDLFGTRIDLGKKWSKWYDKSLKGDWFDWELEGGGQFHSEKERKLKNGVCNNQWLWQQVDTNLVMLLKLDLDSLMLSPKKEYTCTLDTNSRLIQPYVIQQSPLDDWCCFLETFDPNGDDVYKLVQGEVALLVNKEGVNWIYGKNYKASFTLEEALFKNGQGDELQWDRITGVDLRSDHCE